MAPGFQTAVKTNIELQVQQTARVDFALTVGQAIQTVEVAANAALLTTENATVGTVIEEKRIMDLPLNGRNYFSLVALSPERDLRVHSRRAGRRPPGRIARRAHDVAVAAARSTWENYTLDGITNTDIDFNTYILLPSVDALQEFKVQSGIYPAEFGRAARAGQRLPPNPAPMSITAPLFEFLRNDKLGRRDYDFSSATRSATNPSPARRRTGRTNTAITLGGPVRIPKLFNGRNRLFFMSNFEGFKSRTTSTALGTTLTDGHAQRRLLVGLSASSLQDPTDARRDLPQYHPVARFPATSDSAEPLQTRTPCC